MKKILKIAVLFMVFILLTGCFNRKTVHQNEIIPLNTDFISENYYIENTAQIDNENYLLIVRAMTEDSNGNSIGVSDFDYIIYKYNINTGVYKNNLHLDRYFENIGIDESSKYFLILLKNSISEENDEDEILYINYENMNIEKRESYSAHNSNYKISKDGEFLTYSGDDGLYVYNKSTDKSKLLIKHAINEHNIIESVVFRPYEIINNKILYVKIGYEWIEGFGTINVDGTDNKFVELLDTQYMYYDKISNEIYYSEIYEPREVYKINLNTQEVKKVFTVTTELKKDVTDRYIYLSEDLLYVLSIENSFDGELESSKIELKDFKSGELISWYEFEPEEYISISKIHFIQNGIIFTKNNQLYMWKYKDN